MTIGIRISTVQSLYYSSREERWAKPRGTAARPWWPSCVPRFAVCVYGYRENNCSAHSILSAHAAARRVGSMPKDEVGCSTKSSRPYGRKTPCTQLEIDAADIRSRTKNRLGDLLADTRTMPTTPWVVDVHCSITRPACRQPACYPSSGGQRGCWHCAVHLKACTLFVVVSYRQRL
jgi:hypothetical protein